MEFAKKKGWLIAILAQRVTFKIAIFIKTKQKINKLINESCSCSDFKLIYIYSNILQIAYVNNYLHNLN